MTVLLSSLFSALSDITLAMLMRLLSWFLSLLSVFCLYFSCPHWLSASVILAAYLSFCGYTFVNFSRQQHNGKLSAASNWQDGMLIAYASQTGFALSLAQKTADHLQHAGLSTHILPLNQLTPGHLLQCRRLLCIVSTTGEGDAPDNAARFCRQVLPQTLDLSGLRCGILALGDRHYSHYCAFGHSLAHWFSHRQATSLFDLIEVDNGDPAALRHWQHHLGVLSGHTELADWNAPDYQQWTLTERRLLNPGSLGAPAFHLSLTHSEPATWQAGDIAEIGPEIPGNSDQQNVALPHREYSISSIPSDGKLELLVRQMQKDDGTLGLGSGWLTAHASIGQPVRLRIRSNPQFHTPPASRLILIGNGTGLAGLRAHLKQRVQDGMMQNWLLFGERQQACDFFHRDEIQQWQANGYLQKLDLCFSRDQPERPYVQHALRERAEDLRLWVEQGAGILVCGSLHGMAQEVHQTLTGILSETRLDQLSDAGLYKRDVY